MRDLLSRGLGVHHGGLLPIVKGQWSRTHGILTADSLHHLRGGRITISERLGESPLRHRNIRHGTPSYYTLVFPVLIPKIFQGVNMPAKCVVFSGIRKHDGQSFRTNISYIEKICHC